MSTKVQTRLSNHVVTVIASSVTEAPRVTWDESVIDNEHMRKWSSKICCIFSRKKKWDESSSEDDSSNESDSGNAYEPKKKRQR